MLNAEHDIFAAYDCMENDPNQVRFMAVIKSVRESIYEQANNPQNASWHVENETGIISPKLYLAFINALTIRQITELNSQESVTDFAGIPEYLRVLYIAAQSAPLDSSIASQLATLIIPLFERDNAVLLTAVCPIAANLSRRTALGHAQIEELVNGLCKCSLSDSSKLRNSAAKAIYDTNALHPMCFARLFEICHENPLRALTVLKNIATAPKGSDWKSYYNQILDYCHSDNRAVRVKGLELMSYALHHIDAPTVVLLIKSLTSQSPEAPGDVLVAMAQLIQSAITMLQHEDPMLLNESLPDLLHPMLQFLTIGDESAERIINQTIHYAMAGLLKTAVDRGNDFEPLAPVIEKLNGALITPFLSIWPQVYAILATLPPQLHDQTYTVLEKPIDDAIGKLINDPDAHCTQDIIAFVASCINELGLDSFAQATRLTDIFAELTEPGSDFTTFNTVIVPLLSAYSSKKNPTDLAFTLNYVMPVEELLYSELAPDSSRLIWSQLWNALPNCVHTNEMGAAAHMARLTVERLAAHHELLRPAARIYAVLAPRIAEMDAPLQQLVSFTVDSSSASSALPAVTAICASKSTEALNGFFYTAANECVTMAQSEDAAEQREAVSRIDVILAIMPYVSDENKQLFYQMMIKFIQADGSPLQKRALRAVREIIQKYPIEGAVDTLKELLGEFEEGMKSSVVRYRIMLMSTLLQIATDEFSELLTEFLPEIVLALKNPGEKTRGAAEEAIIAVSKFQSEANPDDSAAVDPIAAAVSLGLDQESSSYVAASIEALAILVKRFFDRMSPEALSLTCENAMAAAIGREESEVARAAQGFAKVAIQRIPRLVEESQLPHFMELAAKCAKKTNWEISGKAKHLIEQAIAVFGADKVSAAFPREDLRLLRGARKEVAREQRRRENKGAAKEGDKGIELDDRYDNDEVDLLDGAGVISKRVQKKEEEEDEQIEFDDRGRIVMKEADVKRKARAAKEDDEDNGNELRDYLEKKRLRKKRETEGARKEVEREGVRRQKEAGFIAEDGKRFRGPRGKGDRMGKGGQTAASIAPLSAKTVNKRYRGQMKAAYKQLFK